MASGPKDKDQQTGTTASTDAVARETEGCGVVDDAGRCVCGE